MDISGGGHLMNNLNVTVWNEYRHEKTDAEVAAIYPEGIHEAIAGYLRQSADLTVHTATSRSTA
jgi:trehalose utilization protein